MDVWRFTGPPENWITALGLKNWALNTNNVNLWENKIKPGDTVIFHSTKKSNFSNKTFSAIIGFGFVGKNLYKKNDFWWIQEINDKKNYWPYVVPLDEIYTFSDINTLDLETPINKKTKQTVKDEISALLLKATSLEEINRKAKKEDEHIPNFPVNGSASSVNSFYEDLILNQQNDLFTNTTNQENLERKSAQVSDYYYENVPIDEIKKQVLSFHDSGGEIYKQSSSPKKVRVENRLQKRKIARLENYTCQVCGFHYEFERNGKSAWIYDVDHIIDKAEGGTEEASNLWVLCPNCHRKKTNRVIRVDTKKKKVFEREKEVKLKQDNHLFVDENFEQ